MEKIIEPYIELEDDYEPLYVGIFGPFSIPTKPTENELLYILIFSNYGQDENKFSVIVKKIAEASIELSAYYKIEDSLMEIGRTIVVEDMGRIVKVERRDKNLWYVLDKEDLNKPKIMIFEEYE